MPPRIKRPCRHKSCAALTNDSSGYCDEHRQQHAGEGWRNYQTGKSRQERGYGRPWEVRRARILQRDKYICQECRRAGIATRASTIDHILAKAHGGTDDDFNLEALCWPCHRTKTARERLR
ncbi:TPA: HNH endonuclease [Enterobacter mori]|nr:HNH endonuclease [Enterobacter mori]